MILENKNVEVNFDGMSASFLEPQVNHEASDYMSAHWDDICKQARKMGVHADFVDDLVCDVWLSIRDAEMNGNGYDVSHSNEGDIITVEQFIYGRIKGYSMNNKYRADVYERKVSKDATKSIEIVSASSSEGTDLDKLDGFQKAFALAATYDDIDNVEAEMSLRSNIEFCMAFDNIIGFHIINLFKNLDMFSTIGFNSSIFDKLKEACNYHDEFGEAFKDILGIAHTCKPVFDAVVESF